MCGATWGDYWREIDGVESFFCCEICAKQYVNLLERVKQKTGWTTVDDLELSGDYRGRKVKAVSDDQEHDFFVRFDSQGQVQAFREL